MKRITSVNITFSTGDHIIGPGGHVDVEDSAISDGILTLVKNKRITVTSIADNEPLVLSTVNVPVVDNPKPILAVPPILAQPAKPTEDHIIDSPAEADKYLNQNKSTTMKMLKKENFTLHDLNLLFEQESHSRKRKPILTLIKELMVK